MEGHQPVTRLVDVGDFLLTKYISVRMFFFYSVCSYNGNGTNNFYVEGCIAPVADVLVLQITGLAIINLCLAILSFVLLPVLMRMFPATFDPTNPYNKPPLSYQREQEQQFPNGGYYVTNPDPNAYYSYPGQPIYMTYQ